MEWMATEFEKVIPIYDGVSRVKPGAALPVT
jgi:hypothetical protein